MHVMTSLQTIIDAIEQEFGDIYEAHDRGFTEVNDLHALASKSAVNLTHQMSKLKSVHNVIRRRQELNRRATFVKGKQQFNASTVALQAFRSSLEAHEKRSFGAAGTGEAKTE